MSASHGCTDDTAVVESFKEALNQRVGDDAYRVWFGHGITFAFKSDDSESDEAGNADVLGAARTSQVTKGKLIVGVQGQFALDRLRKNFLQSIRGAAMQAVGKATAVVLELTQSEATQIELPLDEDVADDSPSQTAQLPEPAKRTRKPKRSARSNGVNSASAVDSPANSPVDQQPALPGFTLAAKPEPSLQVAETKEVAPTNETARSKRAASTMETFVVGDCNRLAFTAAQTACQNPRSASPLFLFGPSGTGKSHLLGAIADWFRRRRRMRRVIHLSAETFTNEFIACVNTSGLPAFRARYRDVDAFLVDDVHFLGSKRATIREMLYTVQTIADCGKPLVFAANTSPTEISGLGHELAGRLASGLVCPIQSMCSNTRQTVLRQTIEERCEFQWPDATISEISDVLVGDGRVIGGVVNLVSTLQAMLGQMPTLDEIRHYGGELLRASKPAVTLSGIERAVAEAFQLPPETLRSHLKARTATEPRMLAMYLSRQMTSCAYAEIGRFYGGRSHSTAIVASQRVEKWLSEGKSLGRGRAAISAREALDRIESILRAS